MASMNFKQFYIFKLLINLILKYKMIDDILNFMNGRRCPICSHSIPWESKYKDFNLLCKDYGYTLITNEADWINGIIKQDKPSNFKPLIKCDKGHIIDNTCIVIIYRKIILDNYFI